MEGLYQHAAFGHHIACHRTVDASGEQQQSLAARTDRNAAGAPQLPRVNIGGVISDFHSDKNVGIFHGSPEARHRLEQDGADFAGDFGRGHRETLIAAFGLCLEGFRTAQEGRQIIGGCPFDRLDILFNHGGPADAGQAENPQNDVQGGVQIDGILPWFDADGALRQADVE